MKDLALDSRILLQTEFDCALQEIDILMNTTSTELIGYPEYGMSIDTFLWTLTPTTTELQKYIYDQIVTYCPNAKAFSVDVHAEYFKGNYRSIYLVMISLKAPDGRTALRKYKYQ